MGVFTKRSSGASLSRQGGVIAMVMLTMAVVASGCSGGAGSGAGAAPAAASQSVKLKGVCPDPVVVQTPWVPQAEHGALYELLGSGYRVDAAHKRVTGPLVAHGGKATGVRIELRAGGPAIGFQSAAQTMYLDPSITIGEVSTDDAVAASARQPVTAVVAPFDLAPYMLMWDPRVHPDWHTIADIGQTDTKVLYFQSATYMDYLVGSGILRRRQVDGSFDGSPARFVASRGQIVQQGFATNEPYVFEHLLPNWHRPVAFQLINDSGYPIYPESVVVRSDRLTQLAPCLKRLVPMLQRAQIDYLDRPQPVNKVIVALNDRYKVGFPYTLGQANFSATQQRKLAIVGNGRDRTLGNFDMDRITRVMSIVVPIFTGRKQPIKPDLKPEDLATNQFIDPTIGLTS
ncbi:MAG TPA: hypothetical protein VFA46_03290 [Actinomycetes bacterium]|nr:hypothetical protein [Actinomycetes bacterium]